MLASDSVFGGNFHEREQELVNHHAVFFYLPEATKVT
jgi:hypothetical protein